MSKVFRRSEYEHALNLARKARRRGDLASAEGWLKHADRQIAAESRLVESIEQMSRLNAERMAKETDERRKWDEERRVRQIQQLEKELDELDEFDREDD